MERQINIPPTEELEKQLKYLHEQILKESCTKLPDESPEFRCADGYAFKYLTHGPIVLNPYRIFILRPSVLMDEMPGTLPKKTVQPFSSSLFQRFLVWFKGLFKNQKDFSKDNYRK